MSYVVYASTPDALPEPPLPKFQRLRHTVTGWNGQMFDLNSGEQGIYMLDGVTGYHLPEFDTFLDEHESVDGATYRGARTRVRQPSWTIGVFADESKVWRERDVAWWAILRADKPCMWTITDPEGRSRSLMVRLRSSAEHQYDQDPMYAGWTVYTVELLAEQPYWTSAPVVSPTWGVDESEDFTGPDDAAPDFYIAGATSVDDAELTNPGDVDAWVVHTVTAVGSTTSVSIEVNGGEVGFGAMSPGDVLRINTDPTNPVATLNGVEVTGEVDPWDPREIPASETVPVAIVIVGSATVQTTFIPRHRRAL